MVRKYVAGTPVPTFAAMLLSENDDSGAPEGSESVEKVESFAAIRSCSGGASMMMKLLVNEKVRWTADGDESLNQCFRVAQERGASVQVSGGLMIAVEKRHARSEKANLTHSRQIWSQ